MDDEERRNAQAEHELQRLHRFPAKLPALVERPDPQTGVHQRRSIKHDCDRGKLPERDVIVDTSGKGPHRNIAERMVEEMAYQISKQHQAAGKPDLPDTDAAQEFVKPCASGLGDRHRSGHRGFRLCSPGDLSDMLTSSGYPLLPN